MMVFVAYFGNERTLLAFPSMIVKLKVEGTSVQRGRSYML
jgi:hypothetical protein